MVIGAEGGRGWSGWCGILITSINPQRLLFLQYTNFLSLTNKKSVIWESRGKSKKPRSSEDCTALWTFDAPLIGWMPEVGGNCRWEWLWWLCECLGLAVWLGNESGSGDGMLWGDATYGMLKDHQSYLCDNLCCKTAYENRIVILLVVCGIKRHAKILAPLPSKAMLRKSTKFSIILPNVSQENHQVSFQILKLSNG